MFDKLIKPLGETRVTVPAILLLGLVWLGFQADTLTIAYLSEWFIPRSEAQELTQKVGALESKVDGLADKIDGQRVATIEREIFSLRISACMSTGELRTLYAAQVTALVSEWRAITKSAGNPPTLVSCEDL